MGRIVGLQENMRNEPISRLALREAITVPPDILVRDVVVLMHEKQLGCIIVVDEDNKPTGMFTEAMLRHLLVENRAGLDNTVEAHMADQFPWAKMSDPVVTVLEAMQTKNHRFVCVVDEQGRVAGLTGQKGLMEYIADHFPQQVLTQRAGTKPPLSEREGA